MSYKKIVLGVVFFAVFGLLFVPTGQPVKAMTDTETQALITQLQAQIQALLQQIEELQNTPTTTPAWCHTFNTNLGYANSGSAEVAELHTALQQEGISYGSDGDNIYDDATASAIVEFQEKYASEILAPYGLTHGTGYFGTKTREKLNALYGCQDTPDCIPNDWQCTDWSSCNNGNQTRECTVVENCGADKTPPTPSAHRVCGSTCTPNWQIGEWSACTDSNQTRTVTDLNGCGLTTNKPETTQSCDVCVPNWNCSQWNKCKNGSQSRTCSDTNNCGITTGKPVIYQACICALEDWKCSEWSTAACKNVYDSYGLETRFCYSSNGCSPATRPYITRPCGQKYCTPNWQCGEWSNTCSVGDTARTRTCIDFNDCKTTNGKPITSENCASPTCVPNWWCGDWGSCYMSGGNDPAKGTQTRYCTDTKKCNNISGKPIESQSCALSNWQCGEWSACSYEEGPCPGNCSSYKKQTCVDLNGIAPNKTEKKICYDPILEFCLNDSEVWGWKTTMSCNTDGLDYGQVLDMKNQGKQVCSGSMSKKLVKGCYEGTMCSEGKCIATSCKPNWQCTNWSTCLDGAQTRICTDSNNCGNTTNKPTQFKSCDVTGKYISISSPTIGQVIKLGSDMDIAWSSSGFFSGAKVSIILTSQSTNYYLVARDVLVSQEKYSWHLPALVDSGYGRDFKIWIGEYPIPKSSQTEGPVDQNPFEKGKWNNINYFPTLEMEAKKKAYDEVAFKAEDMEDEGRTRNGVVWFKKFDRFVIPKTDPSYPKDTPSNYAPECTIDGSYRIGTSGVMTCAQGTRNEASLVEVDSNGDIYLVGSISDSRESYGGVLPWDFKTIHLWKYNKQGSLLWEKRFGTCVGENVAAYADCKGVVTYKQVASDSTASNMIIASDGSINVLGKFTNPVVGGSEKNGTFYLKYDSSGNLIQKTEIIWNSGIMYTPGLPVSVRPESQSVILELLKPRKHSITTADGNTYAIVNPISGQVAFTSYLTKTDSVGNEVKRIRALTQNDYISAVWKDIVISSDGMIYVAGYATSPFGTTAHLFKISGVATPTCTPSWQTGAWSACTNSQQTRTVTDLNNCGTTINKPTTTQICTNTPPTICTDPDGIDYFTKSSIVWNNITNTDYCDGNRLYEARCVNNCSGQGSMCVYWSDYICPNGCQDGACKQATTQPEIACSKASDCGTDVFVGVPICGGNNVYQNKTVYICYYPGTTQSWCSNYTGYDFKLTCPVGQTCQNGYCGGQALLSDGKDAQVASISDAIQKIVESIKNLFNQ